MRQKIICECCGKIVHKADAHIIRGPILPPPCLRIKINNFNALHGEETNEPPRDWNIQPTVSHFKSRTSTPKTIPMVSSITGRLNHHSIDNGDVEFHP